MSFKNHKQSQLDVVSEGANLEATYFIELLECIGLLAADCQLLPPLQIVN